MGVDVLDMVPSEQGNSKLVVFVVHDTKFVKLYPIANADAITIARCAYLFASPGRYKGFATDPGSVFTSEVVKQLNQWLDMFHRVSLVDRHESCGVEGANRLVLEHAKALVQSERAVKFWDQPEYLQTVENIINRYSDFETGLSANELTYGSESMVYYTLLDPIQSVDQKHEYLRRLNEYLVVARSESELYHKKVLEARAADNVGDEFETEYQPGDFVLYKPNPRSKAHKLVPTLLGPYKVISQERGEVFCQQCATGVRRQFHISRLYPFAGTADEAFQLACRDDEQFQVQQILGYRGDPVAARRFMTFLVLFGDGDRAWVQYGPDLVTNTAFQDYIKLIPELKILSMSAINAGNYIAKTRRLTITPKIAPEKFFIDLRVLDFSWYDKLELPQSDTQLYVVEAQMKSLTKSKTRAEVYLPAFDEVIKDVDYFWFEANATRLYIPDDSILVDEEFLAANPKVLGNQNKERQRVLERLYSPVLAGTPANRRGVFRPSRQVASSDKQGQPIQPRSVSRQQQDDHVPDIHDGNSPVLNRRVRISPEEGRPPVVHEGKSLVPATKSRRFESGSSYVPPVGTREGLRKRILSK